MPFFGPSSNLQCVCEEWCTLSLILNLLPKHYHLIFFLTSAAVTALCSLLEFLVISQWLRSLVLLSFHLL